MKRIGKDNSKGKIKNLYENQTSLNESQEPIYNQTKVLEHKKVRGNFAEQPKEEIPKFIKEVYRG